MADSSCSTTKGDGLPEGILFEIFLRLPSKSIYRFKCVSKVWLSILRAQRTPKSYIYCTIVVVNISNPKKIHKRYTEVEADRTYAMADSSSSTMNNNGLPEGIMFEIFLRLPSKPIYRFKCVSKVWLSILSDSNFMRNRFKTLFIEPKPYAIFSNKVIPQQYQLADIKIPSKLIHTQLVSSCNELSCFDGFSFSFLKDSRCRASDILHVLASSNGLVLCSVTNYSTGSMRYFVCNPVTKESVSFPPPPENRADTILYGLICETNTSSEIASESTFKVIRSQTPEGDSKFRVDIYFYDLNEWRSYYVSYLQPRHDDNHNYWRYGYESNVTNVITHNGVMYWLDAQWRNGFVAYYDFKMNNYECQSHHFNLIDLPTSREAYYRNSKCLGLSEDSVCYGLISNNNLSIWVLTGSIEEPVWNLRHEIVLPNFESTEILLMAFSPTDLDVVILDCGDRILSYDVTTGKSGCLHRLCVPGNENSFQTQQGYSPFTVMPSLTTMSKTKI